MRTKRFLAVLMVSALAALAVLTTSCKEAEKGVLYQLDLQSVSSYGGTGVDLSEATSVLDEMNTALTKALGPKTDGYWKNTTENDTKAKNACKEVYNKRKDAVTTSFTILLYKGSDVIDTYNFAKPL